MELKNLLVSPQCSFSETAVTGIAYAKSICNSFVQLFLTHGNNAESETVFHKL